MAVLDIFKPQISVIADGLAGKVILIYGSNNLGKSLQATKFPKPFVIACEMGLNGISGVPYAPVTRWSDFKSIVKQFTGNTKEKAKELYSTIIIDEVYASSIYCQDYVCQTYGNGALTMADGDSKHNLYQLYEKDVERRDAGEEPELIPSEEEERAMYEATGRILKEQGYLHYEISNYAKPGCECRHNLGYWQRRDYLGFGLGASTLLNPVRYKNTEDLEAYLGGDFSKKEFFVLTKDNQIEETMFLGLRVLEGVSKEHFREQFSCELRVVYRKELEKLEQEGLLEEEGDFVRLTSRGIDLSNPVLAEFLLS